MSVSIIMPTYNSAPYIGEAIRSVLAQTYSDWQLYIVDDCSGDNTADVVHTFQQDNPNIHFERLPRNSGPAVARNKAIAQAKEDYVAFLDSDDLWAPTKLEEQIAFMKQKKCDFSCTAYRIVLENGTPTGEDVFPQDCVDYRGCISRSNPIGNLTAMYRREAFPEVRVPDIRKRNDFALWLRLLRKTDYCYGLQTVLGSYRTGRNTALSGNKWDQIKYHWQLYHHIEGLNVFYSVYGVLCWFFVKGTKHVRRTTRGRRN